MSMVGLRTKQFVDQHDYHVMKQGKVQDMHDNDGYIGRYSIIEQEKGQIACYLGKVSKKS